MSHPQYENMGTVHERAMEECAEVIQAITKELRFGWLNRHPNEPVHHTNIDSLRYEICDAQEALEKLDRWCMNENHKRHARKEGK